MCYSLLCPFFSRAAPSQQSCSNPIPPTQSCIIWANHNPAVSPVESRFCIMGSPYPGPSLSYAQPGRKCYAQHGPILPSIPSEPAQNRTSYAPSFFILSHAWPSRVAHLPHDPTRPSSVSFLMIQKSAFRQPGNTYIKGVRLSEERLSRGSIRTELYPNLRRKHPVPLSL